MKYTVCGFSQEKFVNLGLDVIDIQILRWFVDFFGTGKMIHQTETSEDGASIIFSWVKYNAVINDLPCLGIHNTRVIGRRFDNLVNAKILEKRIRKTVKGTYTFFHINENALDNLLSSDHPISTRCDNDPTKNIQSQQPVLESAGREENNKTNLSTVLNSDMRTDSDSAMSTVQKSTTKISIYHDNSPTKDNEKAAAAILVDKIREICLSTSSELILRQDFYERINGYLADLEYASEYIPWIYKYVTSKSPRDIRSYFMKVIFEPDMRELFESQRAAESTKEKLQIVCPICNKPLEENHTSCPVCDLSIFEMQNASKVDFQRWILSLPQDTLERYEKEKSTLLSTVFKNGGTYETQLTLLNNKYGYQHS